MHRYLSYSLTKSCGESCREEVYKFHGHYKVYLFVFRTCHVLRLFLLGITMNFQEKIVGLLSLDEIFHQDFNHSSAPWLFNSTVVKNAKCWKKSCNAWGSGLQNILISLDYIFSMYHIYSKSDLNLDSELIAM